MTQDPEENGFVNSHNALTSSSQSHTDLLENMEALDISGYSESIASRALEMQVRCKKLLEELQQFQVFLKKQKKETRVELRTFKSGLQSELRILDKLLTADSLNPKTTHALRSSNFPTYAVVWDTAKSCRSITSFGKRFYWVPGQNVSYINGNVSTVGAAHKKHSAVVTIVAQDGAEWIRVSTITEKRIIWDLAKAGWVGDSSDSDEDNLPLDDDDDDDPEGLLKQAEALVKASLATRVRYRHPKIRLILPRIKAIPDSKEVGQVLQKIRDLGITVQTSEDIPACAPLIETALFTMTADRFETFSETLNIDCTILLAFASDLSHGRVEPEDWHNKAISRQIEMESEDQLLPNSLWPACGTRKLVCTREAAVRMQEIVAIIGTETERCRTTLLLDLNNDISLTRQQRICEFQTLSDYTIPTNWQVPISIIDIDISALEAALPSNLASTFESLNEINKSVFIYGLSADLTTISSNRAVSKEIEASVEEGRVDEESVGPDIWLCPTSRSLVGKEKQRKGFKESELGV